MFQIYARLKGQKGRFPVLYSKNIGYFVYSETDKQASYTASVIRADTVGEVVGKILSTFSVKSLEVVSVE